MIAEKQQNPLLAEELETCICIMSEELQEPSILEVEQQELSMLSVELAEPIRLPEEEQVPCMLAKKQFEPSVLAKELPQPSVLTKPTEERKELSMLAFDLSAPIRLVEELTELQVPSMLAHKNIKHSIKAEIEQERTLLAKKEQEPTLLAEVQPEPGKLAVEQQETATKPMEPGISTDNLTQQTSTGMSDDVVKKRVEPKLPAEAPSQIPGADGRAGTGSRPGSRSARKPEHVRSMRETIRKVLNIEAPAFKPRVSTRIYHKS